MSPGDRLMFSKSSKLCNKEAKASRNYLYELFFNVSFKELTAILVLYTDVRPQEEKDKFSHVSFMPENFDKQLFERKMMFLWEEEKHEKLWKGFFHVHEWFGYFLRYFYRSEQFRICSSPGEPMWKGEVDKEEDILPLATSEFKELLRTYQHTVKRLVIKGWPKEDDDLEIHHFRCLEELIFHTETNYEHFLSKVRKPLMVLKIKGSNFEDNFTDMKQIYQVQDRLILPFVKLKNEQFDRISASNFHIHIGFLTENDIFNFIKSWKNGTVGRKVKCCRWNLESSTFDIEKLLKFLGINFPSPNFKKMRIKHEYKNGQFAELEYNTSELKFNEICDEQTLEGGNNVDSEPIQH